MIEQLARLQLINCQITIQSVQHLFLLDALAPSTFSTCSSILCSTDACNSQLPSYQEANFLPRAAENLHWRPQPYRALRCWQASPHLRACAPVQGGCVKSLSSTRAGGVSSRHEADYRYADGGHPRGDHHGGEGAESARQGPAWCGPAFGDMKRVLVIIAQHCASAVLCLQRQSERVLTLKCSVAHM